MDLATTLMRLNFAESESESLITLLQCSITSMTLFKYLWSTVNLTGDMEGDMNHESAQDGEIGEFFLKSAMI